MLLSRNRVLFLATSLLLSSYLSAVVCTGPALRWKAMGEMMGGAPHPCALEDSMLKMEECWSRMSGGQKVLVSRFEQVLEGTMLGTSLSVVMMLGVRRLRFPRRTKPWRKQRSGNRTERIYKLELLTAMLPRDQRELVEGDIVEKYSTWLDHYGDDGAYKLAKAHILSAFLHSIVGLLQAVLLRKLGK